MFSCLSSFGMEKKRQKSNNASTHPSWLREASQLMITFQLLLHHASPTSQAEAFSAQFPLLMIKFPWLKKSRSHLLKWDKVRQSSKAGLFTCRDLKKILSKAIVTPFSSVELFQRMCRIESVQTNLDLHMQEVKDVRTQLEEGGMPHRTVRCLALQYFSPHTCPPGESEEKDKDKSFYFLWFTLWIAEAPQQFEATLMKVACTDQARMALWVERTYCRRCKKMSFHLQKCNRCLLASYCDATCQKEDWTVHKRMCGKDLQEYTFLQLVGGRRRRERGRKKKELESVDSNDATLTFLESVPA